MLAALAMNAWGSPAPRVLELVLWGFLSLYILGVGLRVHPAMLNRTPPPAWVQWTVLGLWNLGLVLSFWPNLAALSSLSWTAASLMLVCFLRPWALGPSKHDWPLPAYLGCSYGWLVVACVGRLLAPEGWAGAVKHAHASGFVLTMMVGMGLRLVPAFERKALAWPVARRACLWLLTLGTLLRVLGQSGLVPALLVVGGVLQFSGLFFFVAALAATLLPRLTPGAQAEVVDLGQRFRAETPLG